MGEDGEEPGADGQRLSLGEDEQDLVTKRFLEYLQAQVCSRKAIHRELAPTWLLGALSM